MYVLHLAICLLILLEIMNYARSCYVVEIIDFMGLFEVFLVNCGGNGFCVFLSSSPLEFDISGYSEWNVVIFVLNRRVLSWLCFEYFCGFCGMCGGTG